MSQKIESKKDNEVNNLKSKEKKQNSNENMPKENNQKKDSQKKINKNDNQNQPGIKKEDKNKLKLSKKIIIPIAVLAFCCLVFSTIFALLNTWSDKVISGITIEEIDVSGKTKAELEESFKKLTEENKTKNIVLKYEETESPVTPENFNTEYKVQEAVEEAVSYGRSSNIFVNNFEIIKTRLFNKNIEIETNIDETKVDEEIKRINETLPNIMQNYSYYIEEEELIITNGKEGVEINSEKLKDILEDEVGDFSKDSAIIDLPVEVVQPDAIDLEKIHQEIYKEAEDAYISYDPLTVHPNVDGVDFAITIDEAKELLQEEKEEYIIPLKITKANKTLSDLGAEAFPHTLGTYSTKYDNSNSNRTNNINLATRKINGTIVLPGETFSYNKTVGKRTIEAGFREAGAYAGGKVIQEVGGGICQVSSTLYNAAVYANLEIVERYNHYFESSYVPASRDATVSWGSVDFKFKNTRKYPIRITASSGNGTETVTISGIKEDDEYEVIIQSKVISTINRETKYEDDDTIEEGKEVIEQNGHDGCISEAYKILRKNGQTVSSKLLSRDKYNPLEKIIKRGTMHVEVVPPEPEPIPEPEPVVPTPTPTPEPAPSGGENPTTPDTGV